MTNAKPLYFMLKPPEQAGRELAHRRKLLKIDDRYGWRRFHTTVAPVGDGQIISSAQLEMLDQTIQSLKLSPFWLEFDRLNGNALIAGKGASNVRTLRRRATHLLSTRGVRLPNYETRPHLSLAYGSPSRRRAPVPPTGWKVDRLLLVRSHHGEGRHEVIAEWPMVDDQYSFGF
jgi:RNA 2',3'-cyclic 3'-phosphodiesterase